MSAYLIFEDGTLLTGTSIGVRAKVIGEIVFNTSMSGYQEVITDPSYNEQIVTMTSAHIGNTGINDLDYESHKPHLAGLVIRDADIKTSNWRSQMSLTDFLVLSNIVAIANIDTRMITRKIRDNGVAKAAIIANAEIDLPNLANDENYQNTLKEIKQYAGIDGANLTSKVSVNKVYKHTKKNLDIYIRLRQLKAKKKILKNPHLVVYDFGLKSSILNILDKFNFNITIVPSTTSYKKLISLNPDAVVLSNGPGDPRACKDIIQNIEQIIQANIPTLGICLGFQLLVLASGAKIEKMKFGHHGINHPVQCLQSKEIYITSQNHGFVMSEDNKDIQVTHRSLFDNTIQGIKINGKKIIGFQGHPEAGPGPNDINQIFERFYNLI